MGVLSLLFSFSGRINRVQYWLGGIGAGVGILLLLIMLMVLGGPTNPAMTPEQQFAQFIGVFALALIPALLVGSWIGYALAWKRFHDRGKSGVWVFLPMLPSFMMMSSVFGAIASGAGPLAASGAGQPWAIILWLIQLWFFVELGCLPSKPGSNKYGEHPGGGFSGGGAPASGAPAGGQAAPAKSAPTIPGMGQSHALVGAESAIDRAIAARAKQMQAQAQPQRASAAPAPAAGLRPATSGSFGRKATQ